MSEGDVQPPGAPMVVAEAHNIGEWKFRLNEEALLTMEPRYIPCP